MTAKSAGESKKQCSLTAIPTDKRPPDLHALVRRSPQEKPDSTQVGHNDRCPHDQVASTGAVFLPCPSELIMQRLAHYRIRQFVNLLPGAPPGSE